MCVTIKAFISSQEVPLNALTDPGIVWTPTKGLALISQHPTAVVLALRGLEVSGEEESRQRDREDSRRRFERDN